MANIFEIIIRVQPTEFIKHFERVDVERTCDSFEYKLLKLIEIDRDLSHYVEKQVLVFTDEFFIEGKGKRVEVINHNFSSLEDTSELEKTILDIIDSLIKNPHIFIEYEYALHRPRRSSHYYYPTEKNFVEYERKNFDGSSTAIGIQRDTKTITISKSKGKFKPFEVINAITGNSNSSRYYQEIYDTILKNIEYPCQIFNILEFLIKEK